MRLPAARRISRLEGVPKLDQKQDFRENKACHEIIHSFSTDLFFFFAEERYKTTASDSKRYELKLTCVYYNSTWWVTHTQRNGLVPAVRSGIASRPSI